MTDDHKKIGFVPGIALLLSCLALFLIGVNAIRGTPSQETLEEMMATKFEVLSNQIDAQFQHGVRQLERVRSDHRLFQIHQMRITMGALAEDLPADLATDAQRVLSLLAGMETRVLGSEREVPEAADEPGPEETGAVE